MTILTISLRIKTDISRVSNQYSKLEGSMLNISPQHERNQGTFMDFESPSEKNFWNLVRFLSLDGVLNPIQILQLKLPCFLGFFSKVQTLEVSRVFLIKLA